MYVLKKVLLKIEKIRSLFEIIIFRKKINKKNTKTVSASSLNKEIMLRNHV